MELSMVPYDEAKLEGSEMDPDEKGEHVRYRECLRNHAASIGGHANDGCGEFMEGPSLKCAACGCHRNFHRKEIPGCGDHLHHPLVVYNASGRWGDKGVGNFHHALLPPPHHMISAVDLGSSRRSETASEGDYHGSAKKRFRTKFTQEQKEKMQAFAEKLGWRIQKQDDGELQKFCDEVGVKRHVLKVWMHNNKNTLGKKEAETPITV
ncbi:zinc-finger homeodomain protein 3-like [Aristolochia californica]|uniref:zinc-finger homeodomain protein 3-like n=1 Tax=Aristolochia californica TaxID=171875 RepID=UPI0035E2D43C